MLYTSLVLALYPGYKTAVISEIVSSFIHDSLRLFSTLIADFASINVVQRRQILASMIESP
jgi:hypothetical protein